jgi:hypothetical protein
MNGEMASVPRRDSSILYYERQSYLGLRHTGIAAKPSLYITRDGSMSSSLDRLRVKL